MMLGRYSCQMFLSCAAAGIEKTAMTRRTLARCRYFRRCSIQWTLQGLSCQLPLNLTTDRRPLYLSKVTGRGTMQYGRNVRQTSVCRRSFDKLKLVGHQTEPTQVGNAMMEIVR